MNWIPTDHEEALINLKAAEYGYTYIQLYEILNEIPHTQEEDWLPLFFDLHEAQVEDSLFVQETVTIAIDLITIFPDHEKSQELIQWLFHSITRPDTTLDSTYNFQEYRNALNYLCNIPSFFLHLAEYQGIHQQLRRLIEVAQEVLSIALEWQNFNLNGTLQQFLVHLAQG